MFIRVQIILTFILCSQLIQAQLAVGTWRDHLPYEETIDVAVGSNIAFAATPFQSFLFQQLTTV